VSFADKHTQKLWEGDPVRRLGAQLQRVAMRKLVQLDAAVALQDLGLPGNNLEALKGNRKGQHSIRINQQYRVCFVWRADGVYEVEITDYH
jgi:toxin HigB-1